MKKKKQPVVDSICPTCIWTGIWQLITERSGIACFACGWSWNSYINK